MTTRSSTTKTVFVVAGSLTALFGVGLGIGGGALIWAHNTQRDSAGFYSTSAERLETTSSALISDQVDLGVDAANYRWVPGDGPTAVRLQATSSGQRPVFVGVAPTADVDRYLAGTAYAKVTDFEIDPFRPELVESGGSARPAAPTLQAIWAASATGPGTQTLDWNVQAGSWTAVVMNADASPGVAVDMAVGASTGVLQPIGIGLAVIAVLMTAGGAALIYAGATRRRNRPAQSPMPVPPMPPPLPDTERAEVGSNA